MMWVLKYFICLVRRHIWVGSHYRYCLRCGELALGLDDRRERLFDQTKSV